ncbi:MAG: tRNA pseudouridine(38-40) synthase TruA [Verrucomicrobia bacterium]|nr:tRNA pseudouridine(38-40) synthase TruA [Verrucomicrobiota bacterium]
MNKNTFCKFTVAYDGTHYLGWQDNGLGPTIESTLKKALHQLFDLSIPLDAASRTDAGVHALAQIVTATLPSRYSLERLHYSLNQLLPPDLRILEISACSPFHPSLDAISKTYHYHLSIEAVQLPHERSTSWHTGPLNSTLMEEAIPYLLGTRDFSAFTNRKKESQEPQLTLKKILLTESCGQLRIELTADRFLFRMARNLVGTLVQVGKEKLPPSALIAIVEAQNRTAAGPCAPAHGLVLTKVIY